MRPIDVAGAFIKPVPPYALPRPDDPIPEGWTRVSDKGAPHGLIDMSPEFVAGQRETELRYAREQPAAGPWIAVTPETMPSGDRAWFVWSASIGGYATTARCRFNGTEWTTDDGCEREVHDVTHYAEIRRPE